MSFETVALDRPARAAAVASGWVPLCVAAICAVTIWMHVTAPLTADVSWLFTVCERMLAGQRLYVDVFELNPPMSAWLYMPWTWAAAKLGLAPETVTILAVIGLALLSAAMAGRTLLAASLIESSAGWRIVSALVLVASPVVAFAQREHFAAIAALPMLAVIASRASGRRQKPWEALVAGLCGGLALSIKPFFALAIGLPVLYGALRRRSVRALVAPENLVAGAVAAAYLAVVATQYPAFFADMVPIVTAIYLPNRRPFDGLVFDPFFLVVVAIMIASFLLRPDLARRPLFAVLTLAALGFAAAFFIQGKGWAYHLLPARLIALLMLGIAVAWPGGRLARGGIVLAGLGLLGQIAVEYVDARTVTEPIRRAVATLGPGLKIAALSSDINIGSPLHRSVGATLVNRGPSLWMAGNASQLCAGETDAGRLAVCRAAIAKERVMFREDVERTQPDVIVAESQVALDWARADPALAAALDRYRPVASVPRPPEAPAVVLARKPEAPGLTRP